MDLWMSRTHRSVVARLALAAYVVPYTIGVLAGASHGAQHLIDLYAAERARVVAMGLSHAAPAEPTRAIEVRSEPAADVGYQHEHGGVQHSHTSLTGGLLLTAGDVGDDLGASAPAPPSLLAHVPAGDLTTATNAPTVSVLSDRHLELLDRLGSSPTSPPPRA